MSVEDALACWLRCESHYHALWRSQSTDYRRGRAKGVFWSMRAFVERMAPLASAENIYAWTPHSYGWLVLWKGEPVQEKRRVYVLCDQHGSRFGIRWVKDGRIVMFTVKAMDNARWQRIVNWLDLAKTDV